MSRVLVGAELRARHSRWQAGLVWKGKPPGEFNSGVSDVVREDLQGKYDEVVDRQQELLDAVNGEPSRTVAYLLRVLGGEGAPSIDEICCLTSERTIDEMKQPPVEVEAQWYDDLGGPDLGRALAAEPAFWTLAHAKWIRDGVFGSNAFTIFCEGGASTVENQVRNFLRKTSGLHGVRGALSVLEDCLVARGWWKRTLAVEIHRTLRTEAEQQMTGVRATGAVPTPSADTVHKVLSRTVWEPIVAGSVKSVASANAPRARAALVAALVDRGLPDNGKVIGDETRSALRSLGRLAHNYSLHSAPWDLLVDAATDGLNNPPPPKRSADNADGDAGDGSQAPEDGP